MPVRQGVEMSVDVKTIAKELALTEQEVIRESLRAFLLEQARILDTERRARCAKFGVTTLAEMDQLLQQGHVTEEEILEDFQHVDYLTTRVERLKTMLTEL
jgi:hypothetical protein